MKEGSITKPRYEEKKGIWLPRFSWLSIALKFCTWTLQTMDSILSSCFKLLPPLSYRFTTPEPLDDFLWGDYFSVVLSSNPHSYRFFLSTYECVSTSFLIYLVCGLHKEVDFLWKLNFISCSKSLNALSQMVVHCCIQDPKSEMPEGYMTC